MPSIRIGFSTDFNLVGEQVGIGTTNPTARLEVAGQILADNASGSGGISTLTRYDGFLHTAQDIGNTVSIAETTKGNLNSLSGEIKISGEVTVGSATTITGGRLESLTVTDSFDLPHGGSEYKDDAPEKGTTRFNQDLGQLEFYTGLEWRTVGSIADTGGRGRGVFMGGQSPSKLSSMEYVNIHSGGNGVNFGTLDQGGAHYTGGCSSSTRGIIGGGFHPSASPTAVVDTIEYITIASEGNSIDFGNLSDARGELDACSSSTRGVFCGGEDIPFANMTVIDYIEIGTLGSALTFGDMNTATRDTCCLSSPTRGIIAGGVSADRTNRIEFFTIAAKGNAILFGDLTQTKNLGNGGCSNSVRGLFGGGQVPYTTNVIDFITIASNGNAQEFGDLSQSRNNVGSVSTQIRGMWGGGYGSPAFRNNIDYVTIASTGNAQDFGDLSQIRAQHSACSDSHGGLGGF